jgi:type II restriction enzyme
MNLLMPAHLGQGYENPRQQVRVVSEAWGQENLYCSNCQSPSLNSVPNNTAAFDYVCPLCGLRYQLKSKRSSISNRIPDAAYRTMLQAIEEDRTPNLFALHYKVESFWQVRNLILIPHFAFTASAIVPRRKPLAPDKHRSGWLGCDIVLSNIPPDAKIKIVADGIQTPPHQVRESFHRLKPLQEMEPKERGWTLDVLKIVRSLNKKEFSNSDVYAFESYLKSLHPDNNTVRDQIRKQLQILRDRGFLTQSKRGCWSVD